MRRLALWVPLALGAACFLACATAYYPPPPPPPDAGVGVSFDVSTFYDEMSPYGDWVEAPSYGWVWSPRGVAAEWRPYTLGHWAYSDDEGWLWVSDEEWGWAAYHYGRWYLNSGRWFWVPDREWAPAWVAWRTGGGYMGWAPLPPQALFAEVGLRIAADVLESLLEPRAYCFVEERYFTEERIVTRIAPPVRNVTIIRATQNITNYTVVQNKIVNRSIPVETVERAVGHPIPRARIVEAPAGSGPHRAQVRGGEVQVFRPKVQAAPPARKPASALPRPPAPTSGPAAERLKLDQKHAQEKANLEKQHTQEIQNPPKGAPIEQVKARHENEHQALAQKHQQENQKAASRQESQSPKKPH